MSESTPRDSGYYRSASGGKGGKASIARDGSPGCVILYYRRRIERKRGPVVSRDGKWVLDRLGRRFIV